MATVKSLEERIDEVADDLSSLHAQIVIVTTRVDNVSSQLATIQAQLGSITSALSAATAQLAVVTARLDTATTDLNRTNGRIDAISDRIDKQATDFTAFRASTDTTLGLARRAVLIMIGILVTAIGTAFWMAKEVGRYEVRFEQQQKMLEEIKRDAGEVRTKLRQ